MLENSGTGSKKITHHVECFIIVSCCTIEIKILNLYYFLLQPLINIRYFFIYLAIGQRLIVVVVVVVAAEFWDRK